MRTQTTNRFLVEDLEDVGRTVSLWKVGPNDELTEQLVKGHEAIFYGYEFAIQGGGEKLPDYAIEYYVSLYNRDKDVLRASFGLYRAWGTTLTQNEQRRTQLLTMPILAIGGANSWGELAGHG